MYSLERVIEGETVRSGERHGHQHRGSGPRLGACKGMKAMDSLVLGRNSRRPGTMAGLLSIGKASERQTETEPSHRKELNGR